MPLYLMRGKWGLMSKDVPKDKDLVSTSLPLTIWLIGWMMFLINLSFVMEFSLAGLYLKSMGVAIGWIGFVEGLAEGLSFLMKLFAGLISDYFRRRKRVMLVGYGLMVSARVLLPLSTSFLGVFSSRMMERIGNGIQGSPRDALVADIAPKARQGASYGLTRSLATLGSCLGACLGLVAMLLSDGNVRFVFWLATIPAVLALFLLVFAVREPKVNEVAVPDDKPSARHIFQKKDIFRLGASYWWLMVIVGIFMLARIGETMLVLHAHQNFGLDIKYSPIIMILYNFSYSLASYPMGLLADRLSHRSLLFISISVLLVADLFLGLAVNLGMILVGVVIWGLQMGMALNIFMSMIAEMAPDDLRGTAFGCFYFISAISAVLAGLGAGVLAQTYGEGMAFMGSGCVAVVALAVLTVVYGRFRSPRCS
jgi:MFS family permease